MDTPHEDKWAKEQTCAPLKDNKQVDIAKLYAAGRGLPLHPDKWKNWDSYLAIHHVERLIEPSDPVLDAGACRDPNSPSAFLPSLAKLGFKDLTGCNTDETGPPTTVGGVRYEYCDIERLSYPKEKFAFIACLSVIEHGVDWKKYFVEMSRVLRDGGYLFTSFDYWHSPVDTKGQTAFGAPVKIFTATEVMQMTIFATECGLRLLKRPVLSCRNAPVEWMGMKYTFMNLLMKKVPDPQLTIP